MLKSLSPFLAIVLASLPGRFVATPHPDQPQTVMAATLDDGSLLAGIAQQDSAWAALGSLAAQRGQSSGVKDLGRVVARDHSAHLKRLRALAVKLKLSIGPEVQSAGQSRDDDATFQRLSSISNDGFDVAFLDLVYEVNAARLEELRSDLLPAAQDPQVKQILSAMTGIFSSHLGTAKRMLTAMGG